MLSTAKAVVHTGVEQTTSSVEFARDIISIDADNNGKIERITLYIELTAGQNPVNMDEVTISYADEEVYVRLTPMGNKPLKGRGQWNWNYLTQPVVVHTGVESATSSCEFVGDVICRDTNSNSLIDKVSFNIKLTAGQKPIDLDKAVIAFVTATIYNPSVIWAYTVYEGDIDNLLEPGENAEIEVTLLQELSTYNKFTLEFKPEAGGTLPIERTTPGVIKPAVTPTPTLTPTPPTVVTPTPISKPVATPTPAPVPLLPISPEYQYAIPIVLFLILLPLIFYARGKRKNQQQLLQKNHRLLLNKKKK
jgi:flagellin FlaB